MNKFYTSTKLTPLLCSENPDILFIFGDNLIGKGTAGQACIRYCDNSMGIPTKRLPSMTKGSFFVDEEDEWVAIGKKLNLLRDLFYSGKDVCFAESMLGTGLARMDTKSPIHFRRMIDCIQGMIRDYGYDVEELR